jgi:hypothetical protein
MTKNTYGRRNAGARIQKTEWKKKEARGQKGILPNPF